MILISQETKRQIKFHKIKNWRNTIPASKGDQRREEWDESRECGYWGSRRKPMIPSWVWGEACKWLRFHFPNRFSTISLPSCRKAPSLTICSPLKMVVASIWGSSERVVVDDSELTAEEKRRTIAGVWFQDFSAKLCPSDRKMFSFYLFTRFL